MFDKIFHRNKFCMLFFSKPVCMEAVLGPQFMIIDFYYFEKWSNSQQGLHPDKPMKKLKNVRK